jgi:Pyridoxamine 5'-phosphate oxidase
VDVLGVIGLLAWFKHGSRDEFTPEGVPALNEHDQAVLESANRRARDQECRDVERATRRRIRPAPAFCDRSLPPEQMAATAREAMARVRELRSRLDQLLGPGSGHGDTVLASVFVGNLAFSKRRSLMDRHDIDDELSAAGAQQLLNSTSAAHLAYLGKDGTPRVIPVGFLWTGDQVVIATATTSPKVAALLARPEVALTIDAGDTPDQARALSIRGQANVEIVDGVVPEYLAAARKTMDAQAAAEFEQQVREMYGQMARIAITPRWARYYDFGAGRMPRFLQELAGRNRT